MHSAHAVPPSVSLNVPAAHLAQISCSSCALYVPAAQSVALALPTGQKVPFKQTMQKLLWTERHGDAKERASAKARLSLLQKEAKLILAGKAPPEANNLNLLVNTVVGLTDSPTAFPTTAPTKFRGLITPSGVRIAATGYPTAMPTLKPTPEKLRQIYQYLRPDSKGSSDGSVDPDEFVGLDTNQVHQEELQNWLMKLSPSMLEDMEAAAE